MFLICYVMPLGVGIAANIKIGMACKTALVSTRHPAKFKALYVQLLISYRSLFKIASHILLHRGLSVRGMPRYLEGNYSL